MKVVENMTIHFMGISRCCIQVDSKLPKRGNKPLLRLFDKNQLKVGKKEEGQKNELFSSSIKVPREKF